MSRKKVHLFCCFILVLSVVLTSAAQTEDPNLVGWWRLDEDSGTTAKDSSGNNNHGTLQNDPPWVLGKVIGALQFDGVDDAVRVTHAESLTVDKEVTVMAWINAERFTGPGGATWQGILAKSNSPRSYSFYTRVGDILQFSTAGVDSISNVKMSLNEWIHIVAMVVDGGHVFYVNGKIAGRGGSGIILPGAQDMSDVYIGRTWESNRAFLGMMDDVRIYNRSLSQEEIQTIMIGEAQPQAFRPSPSDGAVHGDTWVTLSWTAGDFAVSHDIYLGDNYDDVKDGTGDTFRGNQISTFYVVGFPGFAYPEGLSPGETYYWRIDEVNEVNPDSPWRGEIWRFSLPPRTAHNPIPADNEKFIHSTATVLSWTPGFNAKSHTVYLGDDFDTVSNANDGIAAALPTYDPGPLDFEKVYYWRVDESDGAHIYKGNVWTFTTAKIGGGVKGEYFNNTDLFGTPVLTRIDPQIDFYWNPGPVGPGVAEDGFSVRWTGELEAAYTEPFTFITGSDDGVRLYLDGKLIIENWTAHDRWEDASTPIDLVEGHAYTIVMEGFDSSGEAEWQLYWQSASLPRQIIPQGALSPPVKAGRPYPSNGAVDVKQVLVLRWLLGETAVSHRIYFGEDGDAVRHADTGSSEYKGTQDRGSEKYDPGKLEWNTTYYWRIDEVENDGTVRRGNLWRFTTADFLPVDDFEGYTDKEAVGEAIWQSWIDGFGVDDNGAQVGYLMPPYTEQSIVHSGSQSMPLSYINLDGVTNSEAELTLIYPRDWTENGVSILTIWFRGDPSNTAEPMYVALNGNAVISCDNPAAAQIDIWTQWNIDLQAFADQGINLTNVDKIAIGLGTKAGMPATGGSGIMFIDDIRLLLP
ncbi:MAG: hypothetical protein JXM79_03500 [Sedimentisphaerales bacterium]|nr:hypothetical protein [Sedimentisphaerales bacterium]